MNLWLERIAKKDLYIFGILWHDNKIICRTLENDNHEIAEGEYECVPSYYFRGDYKTWQIKVIGRTRLLFHKGNFPEHSEGCILTGSSFGHLLHKATNSMRMALLGSGTAFEKFMDYTREESHLTLRLTNPIK